MTTSTDTGTDLDRALKSKHRAMWALGHYDAVATELIPELGGVAVGAAAIRPGEQVLDIAAGTGNAALPASSAGGHVTATDLTPELLETGRQRAITAGLDIDWQQADAEALPFEDAAFDVALSTVGIMFAPHHAAAAAELLRVVRPGGRFVLVNWTPEGFIGQLFSTMKPYAAPSPPGVQPPPLWGNPEHVEELLGTGSSLESHRQVIRVSQFSSGAAFRNYFKTNYGPTIAAYRGIADNPEQTAALDADLAALGDRALESDAMDWEYLLVTGTRR